MSRIITIVMICLALSFVGEQMTAAAASEGLRLTYHSEALEFSLELPVEVADVIEIVESENSITFIHKQSVTDGWSGKLMSVVVLTPRKNYFTSEYYTSSTEILAVGRDTLYLYIPVVGGIDAPQEARDDYMDVYGLLSVEYLKDNLKPSEPDELPVVNLERHYAYVDPGAGVFRPDDALTRGEAAVIMHSLLIADNKGEKYHSSFTDINDKTSFRDAVSYLESYGIVTGYPDGTFKPDSLMSRAEMTVLMHRIQYIPPVGLYGDDTNLASIAQEVKAPWAERYIVSAYLLEWIHGYPNKTFGVGDAITRAEAITTINRALGRAEPLTTVLSSCNTYTDIDENHWAFADVLEASGIIIYDTYGLIEQEGHVLPDGVEDKYYFVNKSDGWAVSENSIYYTTDTGMTWEGATSDFGFEIIDIFFFNENKGVLIGRNDIPEYFIYVTINAGYTWSDHLEIESVKDKILPVSRFPTVAAVYEAVKSVIIRPINKDQIYITVKYVQYGSNVRVNRQSEISVWDIWGN